MKDPLEISLESEHRGVRVRLWEQIVEKLEHVVLHIVVVEPLLQKLSLDRLLDFVRTILQAALQQLIASLDFHGRQGDLADELVSENTDVLVDVPGSLYNLAKGGRSFCHAQENCLSHVIAGVSAQVEVVRLHYLAFGIISLLQAVHGLHRVRSHLKTGNERFEMCFIKECEI